MSLIEKPNFKWLEDILFKAKAEVAKAEAIERMAAAEAVEEQVCGMMDSVREAWLCVAMVARLCRNWDWPPQVSAGPFRITLDGGYPCITKGIGEANAALRLLEDQLNTLEDRLTKSNLWREHWFDAASDNEEVRQRLQLGEESGWLLRRPPSPPPHFSLTHESGTGRAAASSTNR
ncbi:MAG: hypothetical protein LBC63_07040 [Holophagales bacterium]|jgi:hypothetical protein|nr:hypothetical protein [Holophagales bacterium]